jgi:hypothetical protein
MVRMSDLVRGTVAPKPAPETDRDTAAKRPGAGAGVPPALPRTRLADLTPPPPPAPPKQAEPAPPTPETRPRAETPGESVEPLLGELQACLARVREVARAGGQFPCGSLERSGDLFWAANNPAAPPGIDYLAFHQARVAVLAIRIGIDLGYERRRLIPLGIAGALIDVGLWQLPEGVLRRLDALSPEEQTQYHSHPRLGADLLRRFTPPHEGIVEAVLQHHERERGQGFPQGLAAVAIHPDAKILGLADTYAGLTVPPTSRPRVRPHEAIRDIVRGKHESFPSALVKALLSEVSVFPPGTLVRLNTGEMGRVIAVNRSHPLRPRVEIVADGKGQRLPAPKTTDLAEAPFLYITGPVEEGGR